MITELYINVVYWIRYKIDAYKRSNLDIVLSGNIYSIMITYLQIIVLLTIIIIIHNCSTKLIMRQDFNCTN